MVLVSNLPQALSKRSLPLVRLLLDRYGPLLALDPALEDLMARTEAVSRKTLMWCLDQHIRTIAVFLLLLALQHMPALHPSLLQVYLKVRSAPGGPFGGLLSNLMKSMAADMGDDEDEEVHHNEDDDELD
jgi:hypothetical protein